MLRTEPSFATAKQAKKYMVKVIQRIDKLDLK